MTFPNSLIDKFITLFLQIVLTILLKILYFIKGEDVKVTKIEVTIKKSNEEKQFTHILDASKEMAINSKYLINETNLNQSNTNERRMPKKESKTEPNLVTGTLSELKPEEIIKSDSINNDNDKSDESLFGVQEKFQIRSSFNGLDILPIKFYWKNGGHEVFITGDFDNWQGTHKMDFNSVDNEFVAVVNIDRNKQHEFKFIVDGDWQPNWDLPTCTDEHGNVNNIIYAFPSSDALISEHEEYAIPSSQLTATY